MADRSSGAGTKNYDGSCNEDKSEKTAEHCPERESYAHCTNDGSRDSR